nr:MAG TPA: hypothetical protein [Caudoviricetes sp.]
MCFRFSQDRLTRVSTGYFSFPHFNDFYVRFDHCLKKSLRASMIIPFNHILNRDETLAVIIVKPLTK